MYEASTDFGSSIHIRPCRIFTMSSTTDHVAAHSASPLPCFFCCADDACFEMHTFVGSVAASDPHQNSTLFRAVKAICARTIALRLHVGPKSQERSNLFLVLRL